eukprot:9348816-Pyramimonas_sp.AAC.1
MVGTYVYMGVVVARYVMVAHGYGRNHAMVAHYVSMPSDCGGKTKLVSLCHIGNRATCAVA